MAHVVSAGVEEEFFVLDSGSLRPMTEYPPQFLSVCKHVLGDLVDTEYYQGQIELRTIVARTPRDLALSAIQNRETLARICSTFDLQLMAAGSHPLANWRHQRPTSDRYRSLSKVLGYSGQRLLTNAFHVHIGIIDENVKVRVFNRLRYYLPLLLALSASSPYWDAWDTGYASYRSAVIDELPRTGIPDEIDSTDQYWNQVDFMVKHNLIGDKQQLWWDIRLSAKFPTVEIRIMDSFPKLKEAIAVACLALSLAEYCSCNINKDTPLDMLRSAVIRDNRWQARRYGLRSQVIDPSIGTICTMMECFEDAARVVKAFDSIWVSTESLEICRSIFLNGNSADRQRRIFETEIEHGSEPQIALAMVVSHVIEETSL